MKFFVVLSLLAVASCHADSNGRAKRSLSSSVLENLIEQFRVEARTEDNDWGLPLLEPYSADSLALEINEDAVTVNSTVSNLVVEGLTGFTVDQVTFSLIGVRFQLGFTWPSIKLTTKYAIDGEVAGLLPLYGSGDLSVETTNLAFSVDFRLSSANSRLYVRSLSSALSLEAIKFLDEIMKKKIVDPFEKMEVSLKYSKHLHPDEPRSHQLMTPYEPCNFCEKSLSMSLVSVTGFLDNEDFSNLASAVASDLIPQLIVDYNSELLAVLDEVLIETIDSYVGSMTLSELLALGS